MGWQWILATAAGPCKKHSTWKTLISSKSNLPVQITSIHLHHHHPHQLLHPHRGGMEHVQPQPQGPSSACPPPEHQQYHQFHRHQQYSGARDFASNMAVILAALALALALNAAIRYLLRRARSAAQTQRADNAHVDPEKPPVEEPPPLPVLVYSASGTKLAGTAAECAICLAEFVDGNAVLVMPACDLGFHARCIEMWLARGRCSSCPTCRAPAAAPPAAAVDAAAASASASANTNNNEEEEDAAASSSVFLG